MLGTDLELSKKARFKECPACGARDFKPFPKHTEEFSPPKNWRDFFYGPNTMLGPISQCCECGFHFLEHPSSMADDLYKDADISDYLNLEPQRVSYFRAVRREAVKRRIELNDYNNIVDFGCAAGNWLEVFQTGQTKIGIELNSDFEPILTKKGILRVDDYDDIEGGVPLWVAAFDFVEHMEDPYSFLQFLAAKPGAAQNSYIFGVPDVGRIWAKWLGSKYYLYCPMHFNYFDANSLKLICERAFPHHQVDIFNSPIMFTNLKGVLKWIVPKLASTSLGKLNLPLGYRANVMAVVTPN